MFSKQKKQKILIPSSEIGIVLRLKREMKVRQKIVFIGGVPILADKTIYDRFFDKFKSLIEQAVGKLCLR